MLLKRIAKNNLREKIKSYINCEKQEFLPRNIASKITFKHKSKKEALKDLTYYTKYCLKNTVNLDEDTTKTMKELNEECKEKDPDLTPFLNKLK